MASKAILGKAEEVRIFTDSSGYAGCQIMVSSVWQTAATATTNALALNTWSHVACAYDKANLKIYVNGVQMASQALTSAPDDTANAWKLGQDDSASTPYGNLNGTVDDFRFYDYARTAKQIVEDMLGGGSVIASGARQSVSGAVAHYRFDEGYGTTANDSSGNSNNLTLSAASWTNSGKYGKAWDGTGARWVSRADDADFDFTATDDGSLSLWFKSDSATNPSAVEYLVNKANATTAGYAVYANTDGTICFGIDDDATWNPDIASCTTADFYDAAWHHIIGLRDTVQDKTYIYIDGVLRDSDSDTTTATLANSLSLYVGDRDGTDNGDEFNGDIDELKIYRYALTADEVRLDYNQGSSLVLGAKGTNSSYDINAANQEYCVPGDTTSCAAPVAEWKFDEGSGTSAQDTSGNANTGTLTGASWGQGKYGKALNFDGSDDKVDLPNNTNLHSSLITYSAWVKPNTVSGTQTILSIGGYSNGNGVHLRLNGSNIQFYANGGTLYNLTTSSPSLTANTWHFIAASWDGSTARIYINGPQSTSSSGSGSIIYTNSELKKIGYATHDSLVDQNFFSGSIDQVRIFNYARSAAQIAWDYNRGGPVGHWRFDECQGTTAYDSSGNSNNGTITIGATGGNTSAGTCTGSAGEAWKDGATGKFNSSLDFDGTDDYVSVADSGTSSLDISGDLTISAWVYPGSATGQRETIVSKRVANTDSSNYQMYLMSTTRKVRYWNGAAPEYEFNFAPSSSTWTHILLTITSGTARLYANGTLRDSLSASIGSTNDGNFWIGYFDHQGTNEPFSGQIDDVKIFNYALTATQVKNLYNDGAVRFGPSTGSP